MVARKKKSQKKEKLRKGRDYRMTRELDDLLERCYRNEIEFYVFGAGRIGGRCIELCSMVQVPVSLFLDNNQKLWGQKVVDDIACYNFLDPIVKRNALCCVCAINEIENITLQLKEAGFENIISYEELFTCDWIIRRFYNHDFEYAVPCNSAKKILSPHRRKSGVRKKIAIYTCVVGRYDELYLPDFKFVEGTDYYIITDRMDVDTGTIGKIYIEDVIPDDLTDNTVKNRYCKMHGNEIFSEYAYSIYLDGNAHIKRDISHYIYAVSNYGLSFHVHESRRCIYSEGVVVTLVKKGDKDKIVEQLSGYMEDGMPRNYGLISGGFLVRDHNNSIADKVMNEWYEEFLKGEKRDQLSFPYVAWKNGIAMEQLTLLNEGKNLLENKDVEFVAHR